MRDPVWLSEEKDGSSSSESTMEPDSSSIDEITRDEVVFIGEEDPGADADVDDDMRYVEEGLSRIDVVPSVEEVMLGVRIEFHEWKEDEETKEYLPKFASGTQEPQYILSSKIAEAVKKKKPLRMTWDMDYDETMEIPSSGIAVIYLDVTCKRRGSYSYGILSEDYSFSWDSPSDGRDVNNNDHEGNSQRKRKKNQRAAMAEADSKRMNNIYWKKEEEKEGEIEGFDESNTEIHKENGFVVWNSLKRTGTTLKVVAEVVKDGEGRDRKDKVLPRKIVPTFDLFEPEIYKDIEICIKNIYASTFSRSTNEPM